MGLGNGWDMSGVMDKDISVVTDRETTGTEGECEEKVKTAIRYHD